MTTLSAALNASFAGIRNTEARISATAHNITNADKAGYTRKTYQSDYFTGNSGVLPIGGEIASTALNPYLFDQLIKDTSAAVEKETIYEFLSQYADRLGTTDGNNTLNSAFDAMARALEQLYATPEDNGLKAQVVDEAQRLAQEINGLSKEVQDLRKQADTEIDLAVDRINNTLNRIHDLNKDVSTAISMGVSPADLEDQRRLELQKLSEDIGIQYFFNDQNQVRIYMGDGQPLLDSAPRTLEYTPTNFVDSTIVYPGGFSNITLNGLDITTNFKGGRMEGLVDLRDTILVEEQDKLNEFATVLEREVNTVSNQGASFPAPEVMTGDVDTTTLPAFAGATGFVRIATTNADGSIASLDTFDVSTFGGLAGTVAAINGSATLDVTASINVDGQLVLTSNTAGTGVAINDETMAGGATDMDGSGTGFSMFFGLNNIFYSDPLTAESIEVSASLITNSSHLPMARLSNDPALVVGDAGVNPGDGSIADAMNDILTTPVTFVAAGNFVAQTNSLDSYTDLLISNAATRSSSAKSDAEIAVLTKEQTFTTLSNLEGVNIDEEMANLIDLEQKYEAAATVLGKIQQLLEELINAVR